MTDLVKLADAMNVLLLIENGLDEKLAQRVGAQWEAKCDELESLRRLAEAGTQPEPVAWQFQCANGAWIACDRPSPSELSDEPDKFRCLYTAPPAPSVAVPEATGWQFLCADGVWRHCFKPTEYDLNHKRGKFRQLYAAPPASALITAPQDDVSAYAERLAIALWEKHYKDSAPDWKPLTGDLMGLLTQIDNMTAALRGNQSDGGVEAQWQKEEVSPGVFVPVDPEVIAQASATTLSSRPEVDHCPRCDCGHLFETCDAPNCDSAVKYHMEGRE